jgi:hypothetical protein
MKNVLMIAVVGWACISTPAFAAQHQATLGDFVRLAAQAQPAAAPRPPAAPAPAAPALIAAQPTPAPPPAPAAPAAPLTQRSANIKFDVTITDTGGAKPVTKTVSMTIVPGSNGSIRSNARASDAPPLGGVQVITPVGAPAPGAANSWLNIDVRNVNWVDTNSIRASITVEYQAYVSDTKVQPGVISASATSLFVDGRRTSILVTSDPISDRKTTVEVTATILK